VGYVNGWLVVKTRLPSFIITLASLYLLRGLTVGVTLLLTKFTRVSGLRAQAEGDWLAVFLTGRPLGLPISIWWWVALTLGQGWVLLKTPYGNWIFAAGDFLRAMVRTVIQEFLEAEMAEAVGAEKGERAEGRLTYRSGYYPRSLITGRKA
jgi:ribose/xylose/arabinose/galactoside ABC-type transport system permease subunit